MLQTLRNHDTLITNCCNVKQEFSPARTSFLNAFLAMSYETLNAKEWFTVAETLQTGQASLTMRHSSPTKGKGRGFPYSLPSTGSEADPSVQAVRPQVTISHPPGSRLPLVSVRPAFTFPATEHHRPLAGTKLYCLMTEAHRCEQLPQRCYAAFPE